MTYISIIRNLVYINKKNKIKREQSQARTKELLPLLKIRNKALHKKINVYELTLKEGYIKKCNIFNEGGI